MRNILPDKAICNRCRSSKLIFLMSHSSRVAAINWHIHHATSDGGQILICVAGRGYYQELDKDAIEMKPGDCINVPANVKHWHGAAPDSWFQHLAIEVPGKDAPNEWCEPVSDEIYSKLK